MSSINRKLGALPSPRDDRDYKIAAFMPIGSSFPEEFILENKPDIYDQGSTSMCVAFSLSEVKEAQELKERNVRVRYSPGFIYANRKDYDYKGEGMFLREALKNLSVDGVVPFKDFDVLGDYPKCRKAFKDKYGVITKEASDQKILSYLSINTVDEVKTALMTLQSPIAACIAIYNSFYRLGSDGVAPDIKPYENIEGYHAVILVGWKVINGREYFTMQNSWGTGFGNKGTVYLPVDYKAITEKWSITDFIPGITD